MRAIRFCIPTAQSVHARPAELPDPLLPRLWVAQLAGLDDLFDIIRRGPLHGQGDLEELLADVGREDVGPLRHVVTRIVLIARSQLLGWAELISIGNANARRHNPAYHFNCPQGSDIPPTPARRHAVLEKHIQQVRVLRSMGNGFCELVKWH